MVVKQCGMAYVCIGWRGGGIVAIVCDLYPQNSNTTSIYFKSITNSSGISGGKTDEEMYCDMITILLNFAQVLFGFPFLNYILTYQSYHS